jgi:uncharacterized protein (TIGR00156 family)
MKTTNPHASPVALERVASVSRSRIFLTFFLAVALLFAAGSAWAQGGFTGPGPNLAPTTVEQAKTLPDDSKVVLRGYIVQSLGDKDYLFKDDSGSITVEIGRRTWGGQQVGPDDLVEIYGEVDKDDFDVEIDVKRIIKQ